MPKFTVRHAYTSINLKLEKEEKDRGRAKCRETDQQGRAQNAKNALFAVDFPLILISLRQGGYVETGKSSKIAWNSHVEHPPSAAHTAKTAKSEVYTYNSHISHVVQAAHIPKKNSQE